MYKKETVTVYRRPRKGFVPPRRAGASPSKEKEKAQDSEGLMCNLNPKKARDLSPVFAKIFKAIENQQVNNEGAGATGSTNVNVQKKREISLITSTEPTKPLDDADWNEEDEEEMVSSYDHYFSSEQMDEEEGKCQPVPVPVVSQSNDLRSNFKIPEMRQPQLSKVKVIDCKESSFLAQVPSSQQQSQTLNKQFYSAVYAKASTRKHKRFEEDGIIVISNGYNLVLKNMTGKVIESANNYKLDSEILEDAKTFKLGGKDVQIIDPLTNDPFAKNVELPPVDQTAKKALGILRPPIVQKPFVCPLDPGMISKVERANRNTSKPMFDPTAQNALVMPPLDLSEDVPVVVDPHLSRHLREHQRDGVTFLYKCVMGKYYNGAILGDEMGLGKTLQCITLLWTLIKQGPFQRKEIVKRALIVAPSSLVCNWEKEFYRWLGNERLKTFAVNSDHPLKHCPPQCPVIIMSYEMATRSEDALTKMRFDIIVCDEAHKIKNKNGQSYVFLSKLPCKRRVLLTGTPVQNDLMELYALVDFANPGVLGQEHEFRKEFEKPIEKYQESHSTFYEKQIGQAKALELNNILNNFFLRRTHSVMLRYLPPRVTSVVVCKPSKLQLILYKRLLSLNVVQDCVTGSGNCSTPLSVILALKKLCNHPNLVHPKLNNAVKVEESIYSALSDGFPSNHLHNVLKVEHSGKMKVLSSLLKSLHAQHQKVVIVSHYTQTLDQLEDLCKTFSYQFKRLDGTTVAKQRQQIVDQFNNGVNEFIFLLSSKAGGLGLNLQGASNIVLYDIDWNPAHDIQAMSRCWRPGQKNLTNIYRLITSGTIEERIFHRQIAKQDLSGSVMDLLLSNSSVKFSPQDLKDIFSLYEGEDCLTHDLIECNCPMDGSVKNLNFSQNDANPDSDTENIPTLPPRKKLKSVSTMAELHAWEHHGPPFTAALNEGLQNVATDIQFIFCSRSLPSDE